MGFLPKGSEDPKGSDLSVLLKRSSDEAPLKGSLSLKGSPPNGSKGEKTEDSRDSVCRRGLQTCPGIILRLENEIIHALL